MKKKKSTNYPVIRENFGNMQEVADVLGRSLTYVANRMTRELTFSYADRKKLAEYLGIDVKEIIR